MKPGTLSSKKNTACDAGYHNKKDEVSCDVMENGYVLDGFVVSDDVVEYMSDSESES